MWFVDKGLSVLLSMLFVVTLTGGEMEEDTQELITTSLDAGATALDTISKFEPKWHIKAFKTILDKAAFEKLAGSLGAVGGVLSVILLFIPKGDSAELKYMKKKFAEVNQKLDLISKDLDGIKDLVKLETQKSVYLPHAFKIIHASKRLQKMMDVLAEVSCNSKKDCNRKRIRRAQGYVKDFHIEPSISLILTGTISDISVFGTALLTLIDDVYKGDINRINHFINSVFTLSFQAQRVILAYNKLTNTQISISESMLSWLKQMYHFRKISNEHKSKILKKIVKYMQNDINDQTYQVKYSDNSQVVRDMKKFLQKKYPWCNWIVFAYEAYGGKKHWFITKDGKFYNMPKDKNKRKRVIFAIPQGLGTYEEQRRKFLQALNDIHRSHNFAYHERKNAEKLYPEFERLLKERKVWKLVRSMAILTDIKDFAMEKKERTFMNYFDREVKVSYCKPNFKGRRECHEGLVRVVAVFKSQEEIDYKTCTKSCNGQGKCKVLPLSGQMYCECNEYYQGDNCESHLKSGLAKNFEDIFDLAVGIPQLSDIYFDIQDMRDTLGISLNNIQESISILDAKIQKAFDAVGQQIDKNFKWANLVTVYSNALGKLMYFVKNFVEKHLRGRNGKLELQRNSRLLLRKDKLPYWLYLLGELIAGRNDELMKHEPLLIMVMKKYRSMACTSKYKKIVYNVWKQIQNLQFHGYMLWVQANGLLNRDSSFVVSKFKTAIKNQHRQLITKACRLNIPNSVNALCNGKFSIFRGMTINLQCRRYYYIYGTKTPSCARPSQCRSCNCDRSGSISQQCNANGVCRCKRDFYGTKCNKRNCKWGNWGRWGSCSKSCGYGGYQYRYRHQAVRRYGGGASCSGSNRRSRTCFNRCCSRQFHCSRRRKCISSSKKCNYINDCGDNQDESSCSEYCSIRYTHWNYHGNGNVVYLDRQRPSCYSYEMMSYFKMQRRGSRIRYRYRCCRLKTNICTRTYKTNSYTITRSRDTVYLDRQRINCGYRTGFLQSFRLQRSSRRRSSVRYAYNCCNVRYPWRSRMYCYTGATRFTDDGDGKNFYLDRQSVGCHQRYFLNYLRLERNSRKNKWNYRYRCCRVKT